MKNNYQLNQNEKSYIINTIIRNVVLGKESTTVYNEMINKYQSKQVIGINGVDEFIKLIISEVEKYNSINKNVIYQSLSGPIFYFFENVPESARRINQRGNDETIL
jgi:hypothetical protein